MNINLHATWEKARAKVSGNAKDKAERKAANEAERLERRIIQAYDDVYEMYIVAA